MATKLVRLTTEAIEIVRGYAPGDSMSRGIIEMDARIKLTDSKPAVCDGGILPVTSVKEVFRNGPVPEVTVPAVFNEAYWKKLRKVMDEAIEKYSRGY